MNTELHKRLEEAAKESFEERYPEGLDLYKNAQIDGFIAGAEHGYKEAISQVKVWMKEHFHDIPQPNAELINLHPVDVEADFWSMESMLADFESDMNKLWEGGEMTNEEKASKLAVVLAAPNDQIPAYANIKSLLLDMAEWKDQQHAKEVESLVGLAVKECKQVMIDKACEFLKARLFPTVKVQDNEIYVIERWELIEEFRKAMTEKTNPLFEKCLAKVNHETRDEVRRNMEESI